MLSDTETRTRLRRMISHKRYLHSLGVEKMARELASRYAVDPERAGLAGLLHDCGKDLRKETQVVLSELIEQYTTGSDDALTHADLGAEIAQSVFEVTDQEILSAIRKHTLGGAGMTDMEKIIYLADFIEPGRRFPGMIAIKEAVFCNLNDGILEASKQTIRYLLDKDAPIHTDVVAMRNEIMDMKEREEQ